MKPMSPVIKNMINVLVAAFVKKFGYQGLYGWIVALILKYGGQAVYDAVLDAYRKIQRFLAQRSAAKVDLPIINSPDSSVDEKGQAYEDFINSGRK